MTLIDIEHRGFEASLARAAEIGGADLIFTSPPYPTEVPGAKGREGAPTRRYGGDAPEHFLWEDYQRLGNCCFQALRPGGFCIVIIDGPVRTRDKHKGSERSLIAFRLAIDWAERVGFRYVEHEAYLRLGPPGDFHPRRRSGWEPMHVFQRPGARGHFDAWAVTEESRTAGSCWARGATRMWNGMIAGGRRDTDRYTTSPTKTLSTALTARETSSTICSNAFDADHPAPFTKHIAEVQVLSYCPPGGLTCDPFVGSGTTAIVAVRHGRNFIGGDLGARKRDGRRWASIARERAEAAAAGQPQVESHGLAQAREQASDTLVPPAHAAEQMSLITV